MIPSADARSCKRIVLRMGLKDFHNCSAKQHWAQCAIHRYSAVVHQHASRSEIVSDILAHSMGEAERKQ